MVNHIDLWAAFSQVLEIVRLEGQALTHDEGLLSRDIHLLQVIFSCFSGHLIFCHAKLLCKENIFSVKNQPCMALLYLLFIHNKINLHFSSSIMDNLLLDLYFSFALERTRILWDLASSLSLHLSMNFSLMMLR